MSSQPHRTNSDFQLCHFIAGSCHTPDGAWNVLYEQKIDLELKIESTKAQIIRREAKRLRTQAVLDGPASENDRMLAEADMIEITSGQRLEGLMLAGAHAELKCITDLMDELKPKRKFAHLPLLEATEAAQRDEWAAEFCWRVTNFLATAGTVPHDHLSAMRNHPDFETKILPHMRETQAKLNSSANPLTLLGPVIDEPRTNRLLSHRDLSKRTA